MEEHAKTVACFENECDEFVYEVLMCKDNEWQRNSTMLISKVFNYILMACCSHIDITILIIQIMLLIVVLYWCDASRY